MIEASHVVERYSPDMLLTPHCHYSIEVNCFRSGKGTYSVAEQTYEIRPDTVFVFGSNVIHRITSIDPEQALDVLKVHFSPSIVKSDLLRDLPPSPTKKHRQMHGPAFGFFA